MCLGGCRIHGDYERDDTCSHRGSRERKIYARFMMSTWLQYFIIHYKHTREVQDHNVHCWLIQLSGMTFSRRCEGYDTY